MESGYNEMESGYNEMKSVYTSKQPFYLHKDSLYRYSELNNPSASIWNDIWKWTPNRIEQVCANYIDKYRHLLNHILNIKNPTFENTLLQFDNFETKYEMEINIGIFLQHITQDEDIKEASINMESKLNDFYIDMEMNIDIYKLCKKIKNAEGTILSGEDYKYLCDMINDYERNGLHLTDNKIKMITELKKKISELSIYYIDNINNDDTTIKLSKSDLDGLDDLFFEQLESDGDVYTITMKPPHIMPILNFANKQNTRKKIEYIYFSRCKENLNIMLQVLNMRKQLAELLGYSNWAEYILEKNMAGNPETVKNFIMDLVDNLKPYRDTELKYIRQESNEQFIYNYDWRYYLEKKKSFTQPDIQPYLSFDNVLKNVFALFYKFFQVKFIECKQSTWHDEVRTFYVQTKNKQNIATIYLDIYPRNYKYPHAACFTLKYATQADPYSICALLLNFTRPTKFTPSLLTHKEMETLYHEFGHLLHTILGITYYKKYSGTQTLGDFVEMPSQILENFCWESDILQEVGCHYKNKTKLSNTSITQIIKNKKIGIALNTLRQLAFSYIDIYIHTHNIKTIIDLENIYNRIFKEFMDIHHQDNTLKLTIFGHLLGGYDSQYYGYMWSRVYADDIYITLKQRILSNKLAGCEYINLILAKGGSIHPMELLTEYLKRSPNNIAFINNLGIES